MAVRTPGWKIGIICAMTIEELNGYVDSGEIDEIIRVAEARQCKALSHIADEITGRRAVRLVLLAGASSAGKTTTAKRLCTQIRVNGLAAMHLSTDDYFVGDARNPRDENGELDYETIECVDMERLAEDLNALTRGEAIHARRFDFVKHDGFDDPGLTRLPKGGIIVLEGLHAMNPRLVRDVPDDVKYRLFIEPQTQPEVFATTRLTPQDARLLRRLVRDHQFRKMTPATTFAMWPKVLAGEKLWIDPFRSNADREFDSGLEYELAVIKPYVAGLLERMRRADPDCIKAQMLADLLSCVHETGPGVVPGDSILRETIGGSQLEY